MKVKIPLAVVVLLALAVGYLMGTEQGRVQREVILVKLGRGAAGDADVADAADPAPDAAAS